MDQLLTDLKPFQEAMLPSPPPSASGCQVQPSALPPLPLGAAGLHCPLTGHQLASWLSRLQPAQALLPAKLRCVWDQANPTPLHAHPQNHSWLMSASLTRLLSISGMAWLWQSPGPGPGLLPRPPLCCCILVPSVQAPRPRGRGTEYNLPCFDILSFGGFFGV